MKGLWLCLLALGCADGDVLVADAEPMDEHLPDTLFIALPPTHSLDATAHEPDRSVPDAEPPPEPDAAEADPRPPPGRCRDDADCVRGQICVAEICTPEPGVPQRIGNGACTNAADDAQIRAGLNLRQLATLCAVGCLGQSACVVNCVQNNTRFSPACGGCVGELVACILSACFVPCTYQTYLECLDCRQANCDPAFEQCSGYLVPQGW